MVNPAQKKGGTNGVLIRAGRPVTQLVSAENYEQADNLYGRRLTLPLKEIYHNVDVRNGKYVQS
jgi:hypothetical protein